MRSYQIIILIGTILGILIVIGSSMFLGMVSYMANDMSLEEQNVFFYGKMGIAFILYIIILIIAFTVKNSKAVGIVSIIFSVIILFATNAWGLVGSALLLAGGIVALVYKNKPPRYNPDTGELIQ
ncbi:MAG TPA: hypothetical protein VFP49_07445 [Nitrososphaeraceae archaeon]|nr:hypothetical protein [Nitrososphaeraceae archaeon]